MSTGDELATNRDEQFSCLFDTKHLRCSVSCLMATELLLIDMKAKFISICDKNIFFAKFVANRDEPWFS